MLPKKYQNEKGNYPQHKDKFKLSYSAYNSWKEQDYRGEFFGNYFLGQDRTGNIFTGFGSLCGGYFENRTNEEILLGENPKKLSDFECLVIDGIERHPTAKYEKEICVDRGWYCIQGFSDYEAEISDKVLDIKDLKTGSIEKKKAEYAAPSYNQTTLYCYARETEGYEINSSGVILLDRKGNGSEKHPLRLTGEIEYIDTPYSRLRAENFLKEFDEVAEEIKYYWSVYQKFFS